MWRSEERKTREASISFEFACVTLCQLMWKTPMLWYPTLLLGLFKSCRTLKNQGRLNRNHGAVKRNLTENLRAGGDINLDSKTSKMQVNYLKLTNDSWKSWFTFPYVKMMWYLLESFRHDHLSLHNHWINTLFANHKLLKITFIVESWFKWIFVTKFTSRSNYCFFSNYTVTVIEATV